jgi:hypothetical protein
VERIVEGSRTLPPTRTREQDALALVDEGGIIVLVDDPERARLELRGHPGALRFDTWSNRTGQRR